MTTAFIPKPPAGLTKQLRAAWRHGYIAAWMGKPEADCPYVVTQLTRAMRKQWKAGHSAGRLTQAER